jgi:hypothetical protein
MLFNSVPGCPGAPRTWFDEPAAPLQALPTMLAIYPRIAMLLAMKWFLCLLLIGTGLFSYNQSQTIETLTANLKKSDEDAADLKRQILQLSAQVRIAAGRPATPYQSPMPTPTPANSWMWQHSTLDPNTPGPRRR